MSEFKPGDRVQVVASDKEPGTVGRTGTVCRVSPLHGDQVPPGEVAVDGVRDPELDWLLGPPTYRPDQLQPAD
ncbi:hypothetical protein [Streptomyces sp. NBC_01614]|uniref:hypothetical protein n=1 Tax=Streptomyces sp. NBC_01614 TaxID=2975897 RepID=UPI0038636B42